MIRTLWLLVPLAAVDAGPMVEVPAGPFTMGSADGDRDEQPVRTVRVGAFEVDRTEVTHGAYAACVTAEKCPAPATYGSPKPTDPVVGVSWHDARAYCAFVGKRLPTEAEWEKAARGTDERSFPWGNDPDCARANFGNFAGSGPCPDNPGKPEPVGQRKGGASPYGALDMGGNVWEWVADVYRRERNTRILRGGSCCGYFTFPRTTERLRYPATFRDGDIGFRCAR